MISKKILHIYKDYFPVIGGIENHIKVLAEAQARAGFDVKVLVTNQSFHSFTETLNEVEIIKSGRLGIISSTPISPGLFWELGKIKVDISHLHFPFPPGEIANAIIKPGKRTVITYHSDIIRQKLLLKFYYPLLKIILKRADRIITTSPVYLSTSKYLAGLQNKCRIIPLGVDVERFSPYLPGDVDRIRIKYKIPDGKPVVLFVGKLRYYKGLGDLLIAMTKVINATLLVVGDGPMRNTWEELSQELGIRDRAIFTGEVPDAELPAIYHTGNIFVLPANSRAEAFGTVILEAMAAGLPIISTEIGSGTSWVNRDSETGLVVPPQDPEKLAWAINLLIDNRNLQMEMGMKAKSKVLNHFSQTKMVEQVSELYMELD